MRDTFCGAILAAVIFSVFVFACERAGRSTRSNETAGWLAGAATPRRAQ